MRPYFQSPDRQKALWSEQQRWLGTPFFPFAASLGHGVDCVNLVHEILVNVGAIPRLTLPTYSLDQAKHVTHSQLLEVLTTAPELKGRFVLVPFVGKRLAGDLLGLISGHVDHHLAIVNPWDEVVHALQDTGVIRTKLNDDTLTKRIVYVLRLMEVSQ